MEGRLAKQTENAVPPVMRRQGMRKFLSAFEEPRAKADKMTMLAAVMAGVAIIEAIAIHQMLPLKERVPYFVEVERDSGRVTASENVARRYKPEEAHVRYFLKQWVENLLTIDTRTREYLLPASYAVLRGDSLQYWREWVETRDRPLKKLQENPLFRREARVLSISFVSDKVAVIRVSLTESNTRIAAVKTVTVHFTIIPPEKEADAMANPTGLTITHFVINDEIA